MIGVIALLVMATFAPTALAGKAMQFGQRTLRPGMKGGDVQTLQENLARLGFNISAHGQYGPATLAAVKSFQKTEDLKVNGLLTRHDANVMRKVLVANAAELTGGAEANPALPPPVQPPANPNPNPHPPGDARRQGHDQLRRHRDRPGLRAAAGQGHHRRRQQDRDAALPLRRRPRRVLQDTGYDCSGSVSYALHGADLLDSPLPSGDLESWGQGGTGSWVTVYANAGHAFMIVAGLRFDTSGRTDSGSRWQKDMRDTGDYVARHPANL